MHRSRTNGACARVARQAHSCIMPNRELEEFPDPAAHGAARPSEEHARIETGDGDEADEDGEALLALIASLGC